jgi:carbamate kinase
MEKKKLIVIAIGGNSLIEDPKNITVAAQFDAAQKTSSHIVKLIQEGHRVVIVHGNGPQVGFILRRAEYSRKILHAVPLDCCVADTQGAIGYNLQMGLYNEFKKLGMKKPVTTIVSQVIVDSKDPSFSNPTKPIGTFMSKEDAEHHEKNEGWSVMEDAGRGYRRVVPSPKPQEIIELESIKALIENNITVIAAGGGGIPVTEDENGLNPEEAVIDKDYAASLLAKEIGADMLIISTAVEKVYVDFGKPTQKGLDRVNTSELKKYAGENQFAPGSMLPKIEAVIDFVESTGYEGTITDPDHLSDALAGLTGTLIKN